MAGCAITALILIVLGFVMALIAGTVKGAEAIETVVEAVTDGKVQVNLDSISDWGFTIGESIGDVGSVIGESVGDLGEVLGEGIGSLGESIGNGISEGMDNVQYNLEDSMIFESTYEIFSGDVEKFSVGSDIQEMDIEVGGCVFEIETSQDDSYYLEAENTNKFQGYVKNGVLHIKGTTKAVTVTGNNDCTITLYVPADWEENKLHKVDMELGAGVMELESLIADQILLEVGAGQINVAGVQAGTLDISVGMGEILVNNMQVDNLLGEVGMGHLYLAGAVHNKADVECSMGSLEMVVEGAQADFNYDVECGMGNVYLGSNSFSGVAQERYIDNGASKKMLVECAMGNVDISFTE